MSTSLLGQPLPDLQQLVEAGLTLQASADDVRIAAVKFGSRAKKSGFEQGWKVSAIKLPTDRPSQNWVYMPALALAAFVWFQQRARRRPRRARAA